MVTILLSILPAFLILLLAVGSGWLMLQMWGEPKKVGRFATIDGLRGYLALFVFMHHACIWYFFIHTGEWVTPPSYLYTNFGQASVALFFMITGFLFFGKILNAKTKPIDWMALLVSRLLRLVPLYWLVVCILLGMVFYRTEGRLNVPFGVLLQQIGRWLIFTIADINGVANTALMLAGVTWSLPYEWLFYGVLPIFAWVLRAPPPVVFRVLGVVSLLILWHWHPPSTHLLAFLGGIVAAFAVRIKALGDFALKKRASALLLMCLLLVLFAFPSAYATLPLLLLSLAFILIACGTSLFGVLLAPVSRILGEFAYSLYLLHGMILFCLFVFVLDAAQVQDLSIVQYCLLMGLITPIIVFFSAYAFRWIEQPMMRQTPHIIKWLRRQ